MEQIIIEKTGVPQNVSAAQIDIPDVDMGHAEWVTPDNTDTGTLQTKRNGTFTPADYDLYGFSRVTVAVDANTRQIAATDAQGNAYTVDLVEGAVQAVYDAQGQDVTATLRDVMLTGKDENNKSWVVYADASGAYHVANGTPGFYGASITGNYDGDPVVATVNHDGTITITKL
jgi:hypothetical protein